MYGLYTFKSSSLPKWKNNDQVDKNFWMMLSNQSFPHSTFELCFQRASDFIDVAMLTSQLKSPKMQAQMLKA